MGILCQCHDVMHVSERPAPRPTGPAWNNRGCSADAIERRTIDRPLDSALQLPKRGQLHMGKTRKYEELSHSERQWFDEALDLYGDGAKCIICNDDSASTIVDMMTRQYRIATWRPEFPLAPVCHDCCAVLANQWHASLGGGEFLTPGLYGVPENVPYTNSSRPLPRSIRTKAMERDAYRCRVCGGHTQLGVWRIVPLSRGGDNSIDNTQTLCQSCGPKHRRAPLASESR
jgi:hypothetical protein